MVNVNDVVSVVVDSVVDSCANEYEQFEAYKEIIAELNKAKKAIADKAAALEAKAKEDAKKVKAEKKAADNADKKEVVSAVYKVGDKISWKLSDKTVLTGTIAKLNEKTIRVLRDKTEGYKPAKDGKCYANVPYASVVLEDTSTDSADTSAEEIA